MNPTVTVVTIVYNLVKAGREAVFRRCVESVHDQTYAQIEHIVIDGASDDGTLELVGEYVEKGWVKCFSEKDSGIYNAMNNGIKHANGKYIAFLNSDDFWFGKDCVEKNVAALEGANADYSYSDTCFLYDGGKRKKYSKAALRKILYKMPFCHQTMFTNLETLRNEGCFNEKYRGAGDYDLMLRLFLKGYKSVCVEGCFTGFSVAGWSVQNSKVSDNEFVEALSSHLSDILTREECEQMFQTRIVPEKLLDYEKLLISKKDYNLNKIDNILYKIKNIRGKIISIRLNKTPKVFRLFGIDFIKE